MEIEKQVCSLELAKKLKELGVKQESYFSWADWGNETPVNYRVFHGSIRFAEPITRIASAFTVAELGEMLPEISGKGWIESIKWNREPIWHCNFVVNSSLRTRLEAADTEADARAKMLIYLLENNLIPKEGVDG